MLLSRWIAAAISSWNSYHTSCVNAHCLVNPGQMLIGAASDVGGDAGLGRTIRTIRHNVDPAAHLGDGYVKHRLPQRRGWPGQARP